MTGVAREAAGSTFLDDPSWRLMTLLQGYRATCIVVTALKLGLVELLRAAPMSDEVLASRLGAHLPSFRRFLRALKAIGLIENRAADICLTSMGRLLLEGDAGVRERAMLIGEEYLAAWQDLRYSVMTGKPAFENVFGMSA